MDGAACAEWGVAKAAPKPIMTGKAAFEARQREKKEAQEEEGMLRVVELRASMHPPPCSLVSVLRLILGTEVCLGCFAAVLGIYMRNVLAS